MYRIRLVLHYGRGRGFPTINSLNGTRGEINHVRINHTLAGNVQKGGKSDGGLGFFLSKSVAGAFAIAAEVVHLFGLVLHKLSCE